MGKPGTVTLSQDEDLAGQPSLLQVEKLQRIWPALIIRMHMKTGRLTRIRKLATITKVHNYLANIHKNQQ